MADEIRVEHAGPADPALEEGEVQVGESPGDPAEEERLAHGVAGGSEVADVVVAEVRRRVAQQDGPRTVVEAGRDLELPALGPHGIVVVVAVDADHVVPLDELRRIGLLLEEGRDGAPHEAPDHDHLVPELLGGELDLLDRFLGRVHGDDGGRDNAILEPAELVGREHVVGPADGPALPGVLHTVIAEPGRGVHDAKVDAEIVQALVHEARQHGRRPVEHVRARRTPKGLLAHPAPAALGQGELERVGNALAGDVVGFDRRVAPDAPEFLAHDRSVLEPVSIGVDDGVAQAGAELPGLRMTVGLHGRASQDSGLSAEVRE